MNIAIILTSHDRMGTTEQKTGFWLDELASPYYAFKEAGATLTLASPKGGPSPVEPTSEKAEAQTEATARFMKDADAQLALSNTVTLNTLAAADFDAVYYVGGHGPMWDIPEDTTSTAFIEAMYAADKPVAVLCHGPVALRHAKDASGMPLLQGKGVTGFTNTEEEALSLTDVVPFLVEDMLKENGGHFSKADDFKPYMVVAGNLISGQNPASTNLIAGELLKMLSAMPAVALA
jgi:putative intracellular protease/amidase